MEQKIIPFETHQLPIEKVDTHALYVMEKLSSAGHVAYLVGGSVRDLLLDRVPKDYDISTSAKPEEIKQLFRNCILIGRRFRLAHIRFGRKILEVSTFRTGDPETEELILRDNQWGYPEQDALRRDFTINGLFYDPSNQTIIDYVDGYKDIERKYLRSIGIPFVRFKQDPVRMLRLLKFQARFGCEVDSDALIALVECRQEITKSSSARVLEEVLRMLESGAAKSFIELVTHHGLMHYLIPEVAHFIEQEKEGNDIYSFLQEIDVIFQDVTCEGLDRSILLSALIYPILQKRIQAHFLDRQHIPHLGEIHNYVMDFGNELFQGFFQLSRKLKVSMTNILVGQYRLTPLKKGGSFRKRIPKDSDFDLALQFLNLRSCLEPGLKKVHEEWSAAYTRLSDNEPSTPPSSHPPQRRKRARRN